MRDASDRLRNPLAKFAVTMREPDESEVRRLAREGWHKRGLVVLDPEWIPSWGDRELVKAIADNIHGKRGEDG